jgi:hypothetical protein
MLGVHMAYKSYEGTHGSHLAGAEYFREERIAVPFYGISGTGTSTGNTASSRTRLLSVLHPGTLAIRVQIVHVHVP